MFVMILVAAFYVADADPPLAMVTRPVVGQYSSKELCEADGEKQARRFMAELPQAIGYAGKCVEVKGAAGDPA